jgi:hypothetical protein
MRRFVPTVCLVVTGCSTAPVADFLDVVRPAPRSAPPVVPAAPVLPSIPAAPLAPPVTAAPPAPPPGESQPAPPPPNWPSP